MEESPLSEAAPPSEESIESTVPPPTPKKTRRFRVLPWIMGIVILLVGVAIGYEARPIISPAPATSGPASTYPIITLLLAQTRHFKGNANAPVTLIEFSDFQWPYCGRFATGAARQIEATYIKTGVVRLGYAHFAFLGPESNWAAEASECADEQGAFWAFHDKLFASQAGENQGAFSKDNLKKFAVDLKLNATAFNTCLDSGRYTAVVNADTTSLQSFGVESTPTFVINGRPIAGSLPFEAFQQYIEAERNKK